MNNRTCGAIQRKLDELPLNDDLGSEVSAHLAGCPECSDFHLKGTRLRQVVGSLGMVQAPADFDFRLRARLAGEGTRSTLKFWSPGYRAVAAALVVVLLIGVSFAVFQVIRARRTNDVVVKKDSIPQKLIQSTDSQKPEVSPKKEETISAAAIVTTGPKSRNVVERKFVEVNSRNKRAAAVVEFSSENAPSIRVSKSTISSEAIFPVDATQQSLRLSLFDSRGNSKTISLPGVSFGSQRVVPTNTSYAPKGVW